MKNKAVKTCVEVVLLRFSRLLIPFLSRRAVVGLSRLLGRAGYFFARRDREIARANLSLAFPSASDEWIDKTARRSFQVFALVLCDLFWFSRSTSNRIFRYVDFDDTMQKYLESGPVVAVTAHFGNWEVLGLAVALHGAPSVSVAALMENDLVNRELNYLRAGTGQELLPKAGAVRGLLKALRDGKRVAMLIDQNTLPGSGGVFVDLFGLPVPITKAPATLAYRTCVPLMPVFCVPLENGRYRCYVSDLIETSEAGIDESELTRRLAKALEKEIAGNPDKWLWSYKRWKYIPENADSRKFPFYARRQT